MSQPKTQQFNVVVHNKDLILCHHPSVTTAGIKELLEMYDVATGYSDYYRLYPGSIVTTSPPKKASVTVIAY